MWRSVLTVIWLQRGLPVMAELQDKPPLSPVIHSAVFSGQVRHRRFSPKPHQFTYQLHMVALDPDELAAQRVPADVLGTAWWSPLRFRQQDYLPGDPAPLKQRITEKVRALGCDVEIARVLMLVQVRSFGVYFSPANFFFCYDSNEYCHSVLVEVSNTPWLEKHYYLVSLQQLEAVTVKAFHVSPFMDLLMNYHWQLKPPMPDSDRLFIHIENRRATAAQPHSDGKLFDATLTMRKVPSGQASAWRLRLSMSLMTLKVVAAIYWQALKLFAKRVPFVPYQKPTQS